MMPIFKFGRNRPVAKGPRFHLRNYLLATIPDPPLVTDWTEKARPFLANILANDQLGDCLCAGIFHIGGTWLANVGEPIPYTVDDVVKLYSASCGYMPGDPSTDNGGNEQTVLNYVQQNGLLGGGSHKFAAWVQVDPTNKKEAMQAVYLFENAYICVELPDEYVQPFPNGDGFIWDVAGDPNPDQGHCFVALGYSAQGLIIDTWGLIGTLTWAALAKYAAAANGGSVATILGQDSIGAATQKSPAGFAFAQLLADIDSMAA